MRIQNLIKGAFCLRGDYFVTFTHVILCNTKRNTNPLIFTTHCEARRCPRLSGNCIAVMYFKLHNKKLRAPITGPFKILRHIFNLQPGKYLPVFIKHYNTVERVLDKCRNNLLISQSILLFFLLSFPSVGMKPSIWQQLLSE